MAPGKKIKTGKMEERSILSQVLGDANAMGLWVFLSSIFEELTAMLAASLGISPLTAGLTILCTGLALYDPICTLVGGKGASFNPSQNIAFAAAGKGSFVTHGLRTAAQAVGGALGAAAALRLVPNPWQGKFGNYAHGVMPGVSLIGGVMAEAALSFALNIVIFWSLETRYKRAASLAPYIATIILIPAGAGWTGPFMNPAFAFSWFYHLKGADPWEHVLVYWVGCLAGSYLAGLAWGFLTTPAKKARRSQARLAASRNPSQVGPVSKKVAVAAGGPADKKTA